jgi:TetR/AcrR family transcriptional repressor of bet genes
VHLKDLEDDCMPAKTRMKLVPPDDLDRKGRRATRDARKQQLIEATIDSLAKRGYAETTMADISEGAGLSRGIVNFHFESKENLLIATLQWMADEYVAHWSAALEKAGPRNADKLWALVAADFDKKICNRRKIAAWGAFWGEAKSRPTYQALCGSRDVKYQDLFVTLCAALKSEAHYTFDAELTALGMCSMMEGLWLRLMMGDGLTREKAHAAAADYLEAVFPHHFTRSGPR